MPLTTNTTKRRLAAGKMALGFGVHHLRTVAAPVLAAATGHDWMFIDTEHGAFTVQETTQLCIAALPTGVTPIVRVCAGALDEATRALDNGAMGIVVPHVDTEAAARRIAAAFHYPPDGHAKLGRAAGDLRISAAIHRGGAGGDQRRNPHHRDAGKPRGGWQRRCHRGGPGRGRAVHRHLRPDRGTRHLGSDGSREGDRRPIKPSAMLVASMARCWGWAASTTRRTHPATSAMGARFLLTGSDHSYIMSGANQRSAFFNGLTAASV